MADSLDVPWPESFFAFQSRLAILQLDIYSLPFFSCLNPRTDFYTIYLIYVIGISAILASVVLIYLVGAAVARRCGVSGGNVYRFRNVCLARALLIMNLAYIAVSRTAVDIYRCKSTGASGSFLVRDMRIACGTPRHARVSRLGAMAVLAFPVGIPLTFILLHWYFKTARVARMRIRCAWLDEILELAWRVGVQQPFAGDIREVTPANITAEHVAALHEAFLPAGDEEEEFWEEREEEALAEAEANKEQNVQQQREQERRNGRDSAESGPKAATAEGSRGSAEEEEQPPEASVRGASAEDLSAAGANGGPSKTRKASSMQRRPRLSSVNFHAAAIAGRPASGWLPNALYGRFQRSMVREALRRRAGSLAASVRAWWRPGPAAAELEKEDPRELTRRVQLDELIKWAQLSGAISIPPQTWTTAEESEAKLLEAADKVARRRREQAEARRHATEAAAGGGSSALAGISGRVRNIFRSAAQADGAAKGDAKLAASSHSERSSPAAAVPRRAVDWHTQQGPSSLAVAIRDTSTGAGSPGGPQEAVRASSAPRAAAAAVAGRPYAKSHHGFYFAAGAAAKEPGQSEAPAVETPTDSHRSGGGKGSDSRRAGRDQRNPYHSRHIGPARLRHSETGRYSETGIEDNASPWAVAAASKLGGGKRGSAGGRSTGQGCEEGLDAARGPGWDEERGGGGAGPPPANGIALAGSAPHPASALGLLAPDAASGGTRAANILDVKLEGLAVDEEEEERRLRAEETLASDAQPPDRTGHHDLNSHEGASGHQLAMQQSSSFAARMEIEMEEKRAFDVLGLMLKEYKARPVKPPAGSRRGCAWASIAAPAARSASPQVNFWYWDIVDLIRKLLLTGVLSCITHGSVKQVAAGTLLSFIAVIIYQRANPYASADVNIVAVLFRASQNGVCAEPARRVPPRAETSLYSGSRPHAEIQLFFFFFVALCLKIRLTFSNEIADNVVFSLFIASFGIPFCPLIFEFQHQ